MNRAPIRLNRAMAITLLAMASPLLAQGGGGGTAPPAIPPVDVTGLRPGEVELVRTLEALRDRYNQLHASNPSFPDAETAFREAADYRRYELDQVIASAPIEEIVDRAIRTGNRDVTPELLSALQAVRAGTPASQLPREQRVAVADFFMSMMLVSAQASVLGEQIYLNWVISVGERIASRLPPGDPLREDALRRLDRAGNLQAYNDPQDQRDVGAVVDRANNQRDEITGQVADAIGQPGGVSREVIIGDRFNGLTIDADGNISGYYTPAFGDPEILVVQRRDGGSRITDFERQAALAFLRENFPTRYRELSRQLETAIDNFNLLQEAAARQRRGGGGSGGSGAADAEAAGAELAVGPDIFDQFLTGGTLNSAELLDIYEGYDPFSPFVSARSHAGQSLSAAGNTPSSVSYIPSYSGSLLPSSAGTSLSAAGTSLSSVGWSLSAVGTSLSAVGTSLNYNWGQGISLAGTPGMSLAGGPINLTPPSATTVTQHAGWNGLYQDMAWNRLGGGYETIADPFGRLGGFSPGAQLAGFLSGLSRDELLRILRTQGLGGLERILAQPFNVLLTWGPGAFDVDLHMTGPLGASDGSRFHIFYARTGALDAPPFAQLIRDCICTSGSEVILTSRLNQGGVYRISAFNFGNQSPTSAQLSTNADLQLLIVRGGAAVSVGNGTTIQGGTVVFSGRPSPGQPGNTWVGVEIDPRTGQIRFVNRSDNSVNGDGTAGVALQGATAWSAPPTTDLRGFSGPIQ